MWQRMRRLTGYLYKLRRKVWQDEYFLKISSFAPTRRQTSNYRNDLSSDVWANSSPFQHTSVTRFRAILLLLITLPVLTSHNATLLSLEPVHIMFASAASKQHQRDTSHVNICTYHLRTKILSKRQQQKVWIMNIEFTQYSFIFIENWWNFQYLYFTPIRWLSFIYFLFRIFFWLNTVLINVSTLSTEHLKLILGWHTVTCILYIIRCKQNWQPVDEFASLPCK